MATVKRADDHAARRMVVCLPHRTWVVSPGHLCRESPGKCETMYKESETYKLVSFFFNPDPFPIPLFYKIYKTANNITVSKPRAIKIHIRIIYEF